MIELIVRLADYGSLDLSLWRGLSECVVKFCIWRVDLELFGGLTVEARVDHGWAPYYGCSILESLKGELVKA